MAQKPFHSIRVPGQVLREQKVYWFTGRAVCGRARQLAIVTFTPGASFGTFRESASHIWMGGRRFAARLLSTAAIFSSASWRRCRSACRSAPNR